MTHIDNILHIFENGITHKNSQNSNKKFKSIGDNSLINTREDFLLSNKKYLGSYIPFYFGKRTPMLYVIQKGFNGVTATNKEYIVYCVSSVQKIIDLKIPFVYTNGHATNGLSDFYYKDSVNSIEENVDFVAVKKKYWTDENDLDLKRRKEAEFLVESDIPVTAIIAFVVYNDNAKDKLTSLGIDSNLIHIIPKYYF
ncbi:DUF4433 domain-containing protein [Mariniflexile jejuense]|uniref:DUF4433 domain-containing protein n=1 Tax=Mariniflexile jejuense TaxID=1173582 RepID=A0ABW3JKE1_9FLAO